MLVESNLVFQFVTGKFTLARTDVEALPVGIQPETCNPSLQKNPSHGLSCTRLVDTKNSEARTLWVGLKSLEGS